jgi:hypothetical protein
MKPCFERDPMNTKGNERASALARVITAALLLLGMEREVVAGDDTVTIGDILLQWTESWTQLSAGGGEKRSGSLSGWEVRLLPSALPSGILHNDRSAVQQVVVLVCLDAVRGLLVELDAPASATYTGTVD